MQDTIFTRFVLYVAAAGALAVVLYVAGIEKLLARAG